MTYTYLHTAECCMVSVPSRPWGRGVPHTVGQDYHTVELFSNHHPLVTCTYLHTAECCMVSVPSRPWGRGVPHTAGQGCHTVELFPSPPPTITYTYLHIAECCMVSVPSRPWGRGVPHTAGQGCHTVELFPLCHSRMSHHRGTKLPTHPSYHQLENNNIYLFIIVIPLLIFSYIKVNC